MVRKKRKRKSKKKRIKRKKKLLREVFTPEETRKRVYKEAGVPVVGQSQKSVKLLRKKRMAGRARRLQQSSREAVIKYQKSARSKIRTTKIVGKAGYGTFEDYSEMIAGPFAWQYPKKKK